MNNYNDSITSKQLIFIFIGSLIGAGVLSLPRIATKNAGQDGWIAVLVGAAAPLVTLILIERLVRKYPKNDLVSIHKMLFGKILGSLVLLPFILYMIAFQSIVVRLYGEVTKMYLLPRTPMWAILLMLILTVTYIVSRGVRTVARLNEFLFYLALAPLLMVILSLFGGFDLTNVLPIGQTGMKAIGQGALQTSYSYAGIEILLVFYYLVTRKNEVIRAGLTAIGITSLVYFSVVMISILVFGERIQYLVYPVLSLLKSGHAPVVERLEFFFLPIWVVIGPRPTINMTFAAANVLGHLMNIQLQKHYHMILIFICTIIYVLALVPPDIFTTFSWAGYAGTVSLVFSVIYPLILLIAAWIRERMAIS